MRTSKTLTRVVVGICLCAALSVPAFSQDPVIDQGSLASLQADIAQKAGLTGQGIVIGVSSSGLNGYQAAEASGALPSTIEIVPGSDLAGNGEGTAMLEILRQIVPQATLAYCDVASVPACAQEMVKQFGANVIVDDLGSGPWFFSQTPLSVSYDSLLQANPNLVAIHAAGNAETDAFVGPFQPTTLNIGGVSYEVEDFGKVVGQSSTPYETVTIGEGQTLTTTFSWSDDPGSAASGGYSNNVMGVWYLGTDGTVLASDWPQNFGRS